MAAFEHRGGSGEGRSVEVIIVGDRRHSLRCRAAVDEVLVEIECFQHLLALIALAEYRPAGVVDELAALAPEVGEPVERGSLPTTTVEQYAFNSAAGRPERR